MVSILLISFIQWSYGVEGSFLYQGEQILQQAQRVEVIPAKSSTALEHLDSLKRQGYTCGRRSSFYRCQKFLDLSNLPEVPFVEPNQEILKFGPIEGTKVINESDDVMQYLAQQKIKIGDQEHDTAFYTDMKYAGVLKVSVPNSQGEHHFIVHGKHQLSQLYFPTKRESRWAWKSFIKEVFFSKPSPE